MCVFVVVVVGFLKYFLCKGYELSREIALKNNHYYYYYYYIEHKTEYQWKKKTLMKIYSENRPLIIRDIFYNYVKKFLSEKLMTTNSCQNMNDERKYTVIMLFIGHPSIYYDQRCLFHLLFLHYVL